MSTLIKSVLTDETIISKIYHIREKKVMLDFDLTELYQVETRVLNQSVKRNMERFPKDFMFRLTTKEWKNMISQIVISSEIYKISQIATSSQGKRKTSAPPYAFTEQGVSMLSGVLNSTIAIQVHIQIIRIFTKMKEMLLTHKDILLKLEKLEKDVKENKKDIALIFDALKQLLNPPQPKRRLIGFNRKEE